MIVPKAHSFSSCYDTLRSCDKTYHFLNLSRLGGEKLQTLPYCVRVLLESAGRNCDNSFIFEKDVDNILNWPLHRHGEKELPFKPARVILQDFTGVPVVVDFAAMRESAVQLGGNPQEINPTCHVDLVVDYPIHGNLSASVEAGLRNQEREFERNKENFALLKWGARELKSVSIVPPGTGSIHQVNLEYLAKVVFIDEAGELFHDSVVGTGSHVNLLNGLGILSLGVGGLQAEAVTLGQPVSMATPHVLGYRLTGDVSCFVTSTDIVLTIIKNLRHIGVEGKCVEFFGPGLACLSISDRVTISNMCPEYGAIVGFFPVDKWTLAYLQQTGRLKAEVELIEQYLTVCGLLHSYAEIGQDPIYSQVVELDLGTVVTYCSGPKSSASKVLMSGVPGNFLSCLSKAVDDVGYGIPEQRLGITVPFILDGQECALRHGSVVFAALASCTNLSNPSVMLMAGLLAKKAVEVGLHVKPYTTTTMPILLRSGLVRCYLRHSGVIEYLTRLGFDTIDCDDAQRYGNSGMLVDQVVVDAVEKGGLVVCSVLTGGQNIDGCRHSLTQASYLASPPMVLAYTLAGTVCIDFENEPLGNDLNGRPVFLADVWPTRCEVQAVEGQHVIPAVFKDVHSRLSKGSPRWNSLDVPTSHLYTWDRKSTYIEQPSFLTDVTGDVQNRISLKGAYVLLNLGDAVTTDLISPAGSIPRDCPAGRYLSNCGLVPRHFNSYGSRRGHSEVMTRGTFANSRLVNKLTRKPGPRTIHVPSGQQMDIYDAAMRYKREGCKLIIMAGKGYGSGSPRDWAVKGPWMLGVRAVIAESFDRSHRSNLVMMGILPLEYLTGQSAVTIGLSGREVYTMDITDLMTVGQIVEVSVSGGVTFNVRVALDTDAELAYMRHGGVLNYNLCRVLRHPAGHRNAACDVITQPAT